MTLPLLFLPESHGGFQTPSTVGAGTSNLTAGLLASADGWSFPPALVQPLEPLFGEAAAENKNFLAGLQAENFLGAGVLPASGKRKVPLAWIGIELGNRPQNLFAAVRGGCWVPGQPSVGRGREWLRAAGAGDSAGLGALLAEIGYAEGPGAAIYFNFRLDEPQEECVCTYLLDGVTRRLHGLALPRSALAERRART